MSPVQVHCHAHIPAPAEAIFDVITGDDVLPQVLTGWGPLPAVTHTSERQGSWKEAGASRRIHLADGTCVRETLTMRDAPNAFSYRVWAFEPAVLRLLAKEANGCWRFSPQGDGTHIHWTYAFAPRNAWCRLPLTLFAHTLWRGYMGVGLKQLHGLMTQHPQPHAVPTQRTAT